MNNQGVNIRAATHNDIPAITEIYNEAIVNTAATFDTETKTEEERARWFDAHDQRHPVFVAESGRKVVGWAALTPWSDRKAYSGTGETTLYVDADHRAQGVGKALLDALLDRAAQNDFHTLIARITAGSNASIRLHENNDFEFVGTLKEVGFKFDGYLDVHVYQKML